MRKVLLCRYIYDPLDRLVGTTLSAHPPSQRYYCNTRLTTEISGPLAQSTFQHDNQLLAQKQTNGETENSLLLATDQQRSILLRLDPHSFQTTAYLTYGYSPTSNDLLSRLGFNGEHRDSLTGSYLLGNGYRAYNPVLMRFNCPDNLSPFGDGGLNAYAYCLGDPVNRIDPTGHAPAAAVLLFKRYALQNLQKNIGLAFRRPTRNPSLTTTLTSKQAKDSLDIINQGRSPTVRLTKLDHTSILDIKNKLKNDANGNYKENLEAFSHAQENYKFENGIPSSTQSTSNDLAPFTAALNHYRDLRTYNTFIDSKLTTSQIAQKIRDTKLARKHYLASNQTDLPPFRELT